MKSFSASLVSAVLLAAAVSAQDPSFQILTPYAFSELPLTAFPDPSLRAVTRPPSASPSRSSGTAVLPLSSCIFPGDQPQAPSLEQFPNLQSSPFTWKTDIPAGQSVGFQVTDNTGAIAQSGSVIIQPGPSDCLNGTASSGSATSTGTGTAATTGATGATTGASGTTGAATGTGTGTATTGGSHSSTTGASGTGTSSSAGTTATGGSGTNGGFINSASMGVVGVLSAVAAALLA
ncbi:hypothetical protein ONZ51_g8742 [Trametes cubensis]|uniref:GPI anchored protein n=1 Tax=Trametes cubensis TaxID=1111947 RepID=A0AAD7TPL9_9APHY|nr:hypothetical protein ONZ51_g8742 [Trametes cubensis]